MAYQFARCISEILSSVDRGRAWSARVFGAIRANKDRTNMGVFARRRSLLIKLVVVVTTAWFTIAFLLYSENRTDEPAPVAMHLDNNDINRNVIDTINNRDRNVIQDAIRKAESVPEPPKVDAERDNAVLRPPEDSPGELGKAVVLPANLTGKSQILLLNLTLILNKVIFFRIKKKSAL